MFSSVGEILGEHGLGPRCETYHMHGEKGRAAGTALPGYAAPGDQLGGTAGGSRETGNEAPVEIPRRGIENSAHRTNPALTPSIKW